MSMRELLEELLQKELAIAAAAQPPTKMPPKKSPKTVKVPKKGTRTPRKSA